MQCYIIGHKAKRDVPPRITDRIIRIDVAQTSIAPVAQIAEPEPQKARTPAT